ncbi:LysM peptidoglycan-binding domain-containing protein [Embleya sp. NPDC001921]
MSPFRVRTHARGRRPGGASRVVAATTGVVCAAAVIAAYALPVEAAPPGALVRVHALATPPTSPAMFVDTDLPVPPGVGEPIGALAGAERALYKVRPGDTLSRIATEFRVDGGWPGLYEDNRGLVGPDPNLIHPGQTLTVSAGAVPRTGRSQWSLAPTLSKALAALATAVLNAAAHAFASSG